MMWHPNTIATLVLHSKTSYYKHMQEFIDPILTFIDSLLHIDVTLIQWAATWGSLIYFILFLIIFCETGLVFMPFLPGDSLLFAVGALAANPNFLKIENIIPLLICAAVM